MTGPPSTTATADADVVSRWLTAHGEPLDTDGATPVRLTGKVLAAEIIGVAMGFRVGHESLSVAHGIVQALFNAGVRALTLEGTTGTARQLNHWVTTGQGDPHALLAASQAFLHNVETLEFLQRIRDHNVAWPDDQIQLVHSLAPPTRETPEALDQIEMQLAETDLRWRERTGQRIAHLGGIAHLVVGDPRTVSPAGAVGRNYGAYIHDQNAYACAAVTVGTSSGSHALSPPPPDFFEHALAMRTLDVLSIDLASADAAVDVPPEVVRWLRQPLRTRCVGPGYNVDQDSKFFVLAGPVADTITTVVHIDTVTPAQPLSLPLPTDRGN